MTADRLRRECPCRQSRLTGSITPLSGSIDLVVGCTIVISFQLLSVRDRDLFAPCKNGCDVNRMFIWHVRRVASINASAAILLRPAPTGRVLATAGRCAPARGYTPPMGEQCCRTTPPRASIDQATDFTIFIQNCSAITILAASSTATTERIRCIAPAYLHV